MILLDYFRLKFGDAAARQQAIESLSSAANRRILKWLINKWLISALKDPEVWVRYEAARVLGTHRDAIAVNPLSAALCDPEVIVREIVVGSLGRIGTPKAVETVLSALELDPSEKVRARACTALGQIADERFVGPLSKAAQDPRGDVQWQAFEALEKIGKPSVDALIGLIENDESEVRLRAAYTLGKIQDERGVPPLVGRLRDRQLQVRWHAANALKELAWQPSDGKERALLAIADRRYHIAEEEGETALELLTEAFEIESPEERWKVVSSVGIFKCPRAIDWLISKMTHPDPSVRLEAARALGRHADARIVPPLIVQLTDINRHVRRVAVEELGRLCDLQAFEPLVERLSDTEGDVQKAAAQALVKMNHPCAENALIECAKKTGGCFSPVIHALRELGIDYRPRLS